MVALLDCAVSENPGESRRLPERMPVAANGPRSFHRTRGKNGDAGMAVAEIDKVALGKTKLKVARLSFGTSGLGDMPDTYGYGVDAERAKATVRAIFDSPVDFLDTARVYRFGRSGERI